MNNRHDVAVIVIKVVPYNTFLKFISSIQITLARSSYIPHTTAVAAAAALINSDDVMCTVHRYACLLECWINRWIWKKRIEKRYITTTRRWFFWWELRRREAEISTKIKIIKIVGKLSILYEMWSRGKNTGRFFYKWFLQQDACWTLQHSCSKMSYAARWIKLDSILEEVYQQLEKVALNSLINV